MTTVEQGTHETAVLAELAEALNRLRAGDVKVRLRRRTGLAGEVVDALNEVIARQERQVRDLVRISPRRRPRGSADRAAGRGAASMARGPTACGRSTR